MSDNSVGWECVDEDPDPRGDLGYEGTDWGVISVEQQGDEHVVFLPARRGRRRAGGVHRRPD